MRRGPAHRSPDPHAVGLATPALPAVGLATPALPAVGLATPALPAVGLATPALPEEAREVLALGRAASPRSARNSSRLATERRRRGRPPLLPLPIPRGRFTRACGAAAPPSRRARDSGQTGKWPVSTCIVDHSALGLGVSCAARSVAQRGRRCSDFTAQYAQCTAGACWPYGSRCWCVRCTRGPCTHTQRAPVSITGEYALNA
eukprot:scaffold24993_cov185-Isochrysis_galbana.AAC.2